MEGNEERKDEKEKEWKRKGKNKEIWIDGNNERKYWRKGKNGERMERRKHGWMEPRWKIEKEETWKEGWEQRKDGMMESRKM